MSKLIHTYKYIMKYCDKLIIGYKAYFQYNQCLLNVIDYMG